MIEKHDGHGEFKKHELRKSVKNSNSVCYIFFS